MSRRSGKLRGAARLADPARRGEKGAEGTFELRRRRIIAGWSEVENKAESNGRFDLRAVSNMLLSMATITLKDVPDDVHAQLKVEAEANFRSLNQEAIARLQRSLDVQDLTSTEAVNRLLDEALASGPAEEFSPAALKQRFDQTRRTTRERLAREKKAA